MGYFSNGEEGMLYEHRYCSRCVHNDDERGCPVLLLHMLHNYEECNKSDSFLHVLIPRNEQGDNEQCALFHEAGG